MRKNILFGFHANFWHDNQNMAIELLKIFDFDIIVMKTFFIFCFLYSFILIYIYYLHSTNI